MPIASNFVKIQLSQNSTKFDWVTRFRDEFNGEVRFFIRDLEMFHIFLWQITVLTFFRKNYIFTP